MTDPKLKYFLYISRAKVSQLHDQLHGHAVIARSQRTGGEVGGSLAGGLSALFDLFKGEARLEGRRHMWVEEQTTKTTIHKLQELMTHIEAHERVEDLKQVCRRGAGTALDAFAYSYAGPFFGRGYLSGGAGRVEDLDDSRRPVSGDFDEDLLIGPARAENEFVEPNERHVRGNIYIIESSFGPYELQLACSQRYFMMESTSGYFQSSWSSSYFHLGSEGMWLQGLVFVTGIKGHRIMGTPLFLVLDPSPRLYLGLEPADDWDG